MIEEGRKVYTINKLYKHSRGFYWKANRMGYIHIIMPVRMSLNGEINHYEIEDRLLTNDNTLRVTKSYGNYDTILDCIKDIEKDLKECDKNSYRYERAEKLLKLAKQFEKFMNKIDSAAGCMIGGNGKAYVYTNVETVEYKMENKAVECLGSLRANQCFVVKSCFNHGISKGYVYQLNEHEGVNGEKYYIAYRLDKKLKKQLTGNANPANCFGYISGYYKERFLKWIETGALAWCEIQEVKTPYKVQKCVKKKIG